jgi:hypothetical protein
MINKLAACGFRIKIPCGEGEKFSGFNSSESWVYLLTCLRGLFNDAFSISEFTASNGKTIVNNEPKRMWKEVGVSQYVVGSIS